LRKPSNFYLSKWYLDCVSEAGDVLIGYAARISWKGLSINFSSLLLRRAHHVAETKTSLRELRVPLIEGSVLHWNSPELDVKGTWKPLEQPIRRKLLEDDAGSIEWNCISPRSEAKISIGTGLSFEGLGYVEQLTMSIPPWKLPFDELRWGRFLSDRDALVWIDWKGTNNFSVVFHNGVELEDAVVSDEGITSQETTVLLDRHNVLRTGPLLKTSLAVIPGIRKLFPSRTLMTEESKWLSRGSLKNLNGDACSGWAIHEVVQWKRGRA